MRIAESGANNKHEFRQVFEQYWERLYKYAFAILQDHGDAQDIIQDFFVNLWTKRHEIIITSNIEAYLFQSVKNRSFTRLQSNNRRQNLNNEFIASQPKLTFDQLEHKQSRSQLQKKINHLPQKMGQVADLYFIQGFNVKEIAAILSLSAQTVRNQIGSAFRRLEANNQG